MTKEQVSLDNGGDGNWGAEKVADIDQIKTMTESEVSTAAKKRLRSASDDY